MHEVPLLSQSVGSLAMMQDATVLFKEIARTIDHSIPFDQNPKAMISTNDRVHSCS